jgi:hypothetical protein
MSRRSNLARVALGMIRLANGAIALTAPQVITHRFDTEGQGDPPPAAIYALRMFGVRTVLLAIDLLRPAGPERSHAMRFAPVIHATDLCTAVLVARSGRVPRQTGMLIVGISGLNTLLSLMMREKRTARAETNS